MKKYYKYNKLSNFSTLKLTINLLIISQLALFGCSSLVTEVSPSLLPSTTSELVVACFISPQDTVLSAKVTETKTVINSTGSIKDDITTATVKLSDGTKTVQLIYNAGDGYYRALPKDLPIIAGKTYSIVVSSTDGRQVNATTTVPPNTPINSLKLDSAVVSVTHRGNTTMATEYTVKMIWQDVAGVANFYRGIGFFNQIYNNNGTNLSVLNLVDFLTTNDVGTDGQLMSLTGTYQASNNINGGPPGNGNQIIGTGRLNKLTVGLFQTDINYFNYQSALRKQRQNNNPFAEPVLLFTNINGGFGCFGSYNATWQDVKVK